MAYQCILPPKQAVRLTDGLEYSQEDQVVPHITKMLLGTHGIPVHPSAETSRMAH